MSSASGDRSLGVVAQTVESMQCGKKKEGVGAQQGQWDEREWMCFCGNHVCVLAIRCARELWSGRGRLLAEESLGWNVNPGANRWLFSISLCADCLPEGLNGGCVLNAG